MIKILLLTISFFLLLFLESFFLRVFSFSLFIVITISIWKKVDDLIFYPFITLFGVILDTVTHAPLGMHTLVIAILLLFIDLLWFFIPRDGKFGYIPVFLFVFLYYVLVLVVSSLLEDGVFPSILIGSWINMILKSLFSVILYLFAYRFIKLIRDDKTEGKIRLS